MQIVNNLVLFPASLAGFEEGLGGVFGGVFDGRDGERGGVCCECVWRGGELVESGLDCSAFCRCGGLGLRLTALAVLSKD